MVMYRKFLASRPRASEVNARLFANIWQHPAAPAPKLPTHSHGHLAATLEQRPATAAAPKLQSAHNHCFLYLKSELRTPIALGIWGKMLPNFSIKLQPHTSAPLVAYGFGMPALSC